jgi:hypothetical protein
MQFDAVVEAIQEAFIAGMSSLNPQTQIALDNETFDETSVPANSPFTRVTIRETASRQQSLGLVGARKWERFGRVTVQCFHPIGLGSQAATQFAETVRTLLEGSRPAAQLWFEAAALHPIGPDGQAWFQVNVDAPFRYQHTH